MAGKKTKKRRKVGFPIRERSGAERLRLRQFDELTRANHSSGYRVGGKLEPPNKEER